MFAPFWALNPALMPAFVPTLSNMSPRRVSSANTSPPEYAAPDQSAPPEYPLRDLPAEPARPKEAHTHCPRNETTAEAANPGLADDYIDMQDGLHFDVEANTAVATTGHVAPRPNLDQDINRQLGRQRRRITCLDTLTCLIAVLIMVFWPVNVTLELTGALCQSTVSKILFCGLPPLALFILWIAMLQGEGYWAISREGRTKVQHMMWRGVRQGAMFSLMIVSALALIMSKHVVCLDGCAHGAGDGEKCIEDGVSWFW